MQLCIAATQRPTQKAMGQGAVRSQMDLRICFRVRERKDVDLILGQGMFAVGWHAHTLNAPRQVPDQRKHRRTVRDYERLPASHEAMVLWAMIALMAHRLAHTAAATTND